MLTKPRWEKEVELMEESFPHFSWFASPPWFGFQGYVRGPRSGRAYEVVLEGNERTYPQCKPAIYMDPRVGPHWAEAGVHGFQGRQGMSQLCVLKEWIPSRSTFANTLLSAIKYLEKFDA